MTAARVPLKNLFLHVANLPTRLRRITSAGAYRPEIDGLRFFAIGIVIIGHLSERVARFQQGVSVPGNFESALFGLLDNPAQGVMLFFTISGFIIASQYLRKSPNPLSAGYMKPYFIRRVTRIEPPYFILLIATYLLLEFTSFTPPDVHRFWSQPASLTASLIASLFYSHGWLYGTFPRLFGAGWSLEIEVQFYITAPLLFYFLFTRIRTPRRIVAGLLCLTAAVAIAQVTKSFDEPHLAKTLLIFLPYFLLGLILADLNQRYPELLSPIPTAVLSAAAWLAALAFFALSTRAPIPYALLQAGQLLLIAVMFAGAFGHGSFRAFCASPWISLIGGACYSLYLTHLQLLQMSAFAIHVLLGHHAPSSWIVALALNAIIQVPLVVVAGLVFYTYVERPFMTPRWPSLVAGRLRDLVSGNGRKAILAKPGDQPGLRQPPETEHPQAQG